jgi:hypothetical protein
MQTGDEGQLAHRGAVSAQPPAASAQGDSIWQSCIAVTTPLDVKAAASSGLVRRNRTERRPLGREILRDTDLATQGKVPTSFGMTYAAEAAGSGLDIGKL